MAGPPRRRERPDDRQVGRRFATGLDSEGVHRRPDEAHLLARLPQFGPRGALDVLLVHRDRAAAARLDDIARRHAQIRDIADGAKQLVDPIGHRIGELEHSDLLGPDPDLVGGQPLGQCDRDPDRALVGEAGDSVVAVRAVGGRRQQVAHAEEAGNEAGPRPLIQAGGIAELLVSTVVHDRDAIRHRHRFFLVVGHEDERDPDLLLDPLELDLHLLAQLQVECAERFVEEQDGGSIDEGAGKRHTLCLPTGDLGRLASLEAGQLDELEHVGDAGLDLAVADLRAAQAEGDVLVDRQVGEERVILEDGVDVTLVGRQPGDVLTL